MALHSFILNFLKTTPLQNRTEARKRTTPGYSSDFLTQAHKGCTSHQDEILSGEWCGCFYCEQTFSPVEIEEWMEENTAVGETAICPNAALTRY